MRSAPSLLVLHGTWEVEDVPGRKASAVPGRAALGTTPGSGALPAWMAPEQNRPWKGA